MTEERENQAAEVEGDSSDDHSEGAIDRGVAQGRVSRIPLLVVVAVLVAVAGIGAFLTRNSSSEAPINAEDQQTTTTVTAAPTSLIPKSEVGSSPSVTAGVPSTSPTATSANAETADAAAPATCDPGLLLLAVRESGQVDPSLADSIEVESQSCVDGFAQARLQAAGADDVSAYFQQSGTSWRLLVLGTALDPVQAGVPAGIAEKLRD